MALDSQPVREFPPVIPVELLKNWLAKIFPEGTAHRNYVIREMAAKTIFVMLYTGAIEGADRWFRPAQATLMSDRQARAVTHQDREKWAKDSLTAGRLKNSTGCWYATNSREPIRDETLRAGLVPLGAVVEKSGVPTTSGRPRYAIARSFHELLLALLVDGANASAITKWQKANLSAEALARVTLLKRGVATGVLGERLKINFPNGESRMMINGPSAVITKAVIEVFSTGFLVKPAVLFVSDSGEKVIARDQELARELGLNIQADRNLPDVILVDVASGRERIIFVEIVATDGAITASRKEALSRLASGAKFGRESVYFVTAFADRSSPSFRKLASEIAWNTFAWFVSEPTNLLCYRANALLSISSLPNVV